MNTKQLGQPIYEAYIAALLKNMGVSRAPDDWETLTPEDQAAWANAEMASIDQAAKRDSVEDAVRTLVHACHSAALAGGWWIDTETGQDVRSWPDKYFKLWVGTKLALVHSEVSEGLEGHRKGLQDDKLPHFKMLDVELADAMIRICDLAGGLNSQIAAATSQKLAFNAQRPDHKIASRLAEGGKSY